MDDMTTNYGNDDCDVYSDGEEGDLIVDVDGEEEVRSGGNSEGEDITAPIHGEDSDDQVLSNCFSTIKFYKVDARSRFCWKSKKINRFIHTFALTW